MKKLFLITGLLLSSVSYGYHIPIEDHQCSGLVRILRVEKVDTDAGPKYWAMTTSGKMQIKSASRAIEEDIYQTLLKNKNRIWGALFVAPMYYGYALHSAHSIFDITKEPYKEVDKNNQRIEPNLNKEI